MNFISSKSLYAINQKENAVIDVWEKSWSQLNKGSYSYIIEQKLYTNSMRLHARAFYYFGREAKQDNFKKQKRQKTIFY